MEFSLESEKNRLSSASKFNQLRIPSSLISNSMKIYCQSHKFNFCLLYRHIFRTERRWSDWRSSKRQTIICWSDWTNWRTPKVHCSKIFDKFLYGIFIFTMKKISFNQLISFRRADGDSLNPRSHFFEFLFSFWGF